MNVTVIFDCFELEAVLGDGRFMLRSSSIDSNLKLC